MKLGEPFLAENDNIQRNLRAGIHAARTGNRTTARRLLRDVVSEDPYNELGWIWLASVTTSNRDKRQYLEQVLAINPNNPLAKEALAKIGGASQSPDGQARTQRAQSGGGINLTNILMGIVVAVFIVAGLAGLSAISDQNSQNESNEQTEIAALARQQTAVAQPTALPTTVRLIVTLDRRTQVGQPLPPSVTPTPSPTLTIEPSPTENPFPLEDFMALYTSLVTGDTSYSLFQINGDGSNEQLIGADFRDVAFDPAGSRIAFVRDVEYVGEIETVESPADVQPESTEEVVAEPIDSSGTFFAPELFIADLDDLDNAVQITELRSSELSSPTWSPEGTELVFVSNFDGDADLWYVTPDGNNLRNLFQDQIEPINDRDPAWSPIVGSRQIIFSSSPENGISSEIYSMEVTEPGVEFPIIQFTDAAGSSYAPHWSPNGDSIVFLSDRRGDADVHLMNPDGTNERLLTESDNDAEDRNPSFTPDGNWIVFVSNRDGDRFQSYLLSLDGRILERITNSDNNDQQIIFRPDIRLRFQ